MSIENQTKQLTLGSLFDGSGGFPLAGMLSGIKPIWASEIEPFPIRVTTKRLKDIKHYGDISTLDGAEIEPVDVITFGSPCQDLSVAGKRAGIKDGERSSLFFEAIRVIKEMRCATNGQYPKYIVWENVPGAFSSNKGDDFRCVLESICQIADETVSIPKPPKEKWTPAGSIVGDGYSVVWRTLDAQYWGVPQRRKRIYLVGSFNSECAEEILFKSEGLSGYSAESCKSWKRFAKNPENGIGTAERGINNIPDAIFDVRITSDGTKNWRAHCYETDIARSLDTGGHNPDSSHGGVVIVLNDQGGKQMNVSEYVTGTLRAQEHGHPPLVFEPDAVAYTTQACGDRDNPSQSYQKDVAYTIPANPMSDRGQAVVYGICAYESNSMKSSNPNSGIYEADVSRTLDLNGGSPACNQGGMAIVQSAGFSYGQSANARSIGYEEEISPTLRGGEGGNQKPCVVVKEEENKVFDARGNGDGRISPTITGDHNDRVTDYTALCVALEGNGSRPSHKGDGYSTDGVSYTLNSVEHHAVCYGIGNGQVNDAVQMCPEVVKTLDCMHDIQKVLALSNVAAARCAQDGRGAVHTQMMSNPEENFVVETGDNVTNADSSVCESYQDKVGCLDADIHKGVNNQIATNDMLIANGYIVRRLTPTECARLQGFPDSWCSNLKEETPSEEELAFWEDVFETHRKVTKGSSKPKSRKQIIKWLKSPHSDSAEYKMWGNGIALPCAWFVLAGISWADTKKMER